MVFWVCLPPQLIISIFAKISRAGQVLRPSFLAQASSHGRGSPGGPAPRPVARADNGPRHRRAEPGLADQSRGADRGAPSGAVAIGYVDRIRHAAQELIPAGRWGAASHRATYRAGKRAGRPRRLGAGGKGYHSSPRASARWAPSTPRTWGWSARPVWRGSVSANSRADDRGERPPPPPAPRCPRGPTDATTRPSS